MKILISSRLIILVVVWLLRGVRPPFIPILLLLLGLLAEPLWHLWSSVSDGLHLRFSAIGPPLFIPLIQYWFLIPLTPRIFKLSIRLLVSFWLSLPRVHVWLPLGLLRVLNMLLPLIPILLLGRLAQPLWHLLYTLPYRLRPVKRLLVLLLILGWLHLGLSTIRRIPPYLCPIH